MVSPPAPLSPPSGRRARDAWSRVGNWAGGGGCAAGRGGRQGHCSVSFSATPPPQPGPQPSRRPSPPGREPGPPARSANFFFFFLSPFCKNFFSLLATGAPPLTARSLPISFLQAVLEDEVGWLEVGEGVPGLWHPQDPQDPPPPLRDPILPTTPPPPTRFSWWAVNPGADPGIGCPRRGPEPGPGKLWGKYCAAAGGGGGRGGVGGGG